MPAASKNPLPDLMAMFQSSGLKEKLLFTLMMIGVYRLGVQIPVWGVTPEGLTFLAKGGLGGFLDMFSGGALARLSLLALGIGPYITSSIIIQLLTAVIPALEEMQKEEGEAGRRKISQYTRYFTIVLAGFQAFFVASLAVNHHALQPGVDPAIFYPLTILALTTGSLFALWAAELITEKGIGNGASLLIFIGILSGIPLYAQRTATLVSGDSHLSLNLVMLLAIYVGVIFLIIILQEASRKIFIVTAKRQVGNKIYGGQNTYIPFKINPAGVLPIIFTFAFLAFPTTVMQLIPAGVKTVGAAAPQAAGFDFMATVQPVLAEVSLFFKRYFTFGSPLYILVEFLLIIGFTFFYASITPSMQPKEIADQLKKYGSAIPGIKPGKPTADKLNEVLTRTTFIGAVALAVVTLIASSATTLTEITTLRGLGSTSLIILVGVALDTVNQIKVNLMARQYEGFLK